MKDRGKSFKSCNNAKSGCNNAKSDGRKDRKSATGMSGSPKKGGHGGKFTWAGDGYSQAEIGVGKEAVDVKDPNFEDPVEIETV
ncbi:hypothetical protein JCGZ_07351 [Jatropha curcas]|uniref:Programmed cell death protein 4-like n=1 Tax=Jatropha curcas TaxID=180498 RepID=A0A067KND1_JATCU|nr:hypothetical protein JCGZ_07351 [Jatropha curcas]